MLESFRQLERPKKALIIDDWHEARLNPDGRRNYLEIAGRYFGKILLFTDELFQIQEMVNNSPDTLLAFDYASAMEFGHALRGELIDRWVSLGREHVASMRDLAREIEETENLVRDLIGKKTLPSVPFIVVCILQADQEDKAEAPEAGSFGYLYEVLVTTALNMSSGRKVQLEKKYVFLSMLAYEMFSQNVDTVSSTRARQIAEAYALSHLVKIDVDTLLTDLEEARVLNKLDGNYHFYYSHLLYYFVARYYKDNLSGDSGDKLRSEIEEMANRISSDKYSTILMFLIYLTRDSTGLIGQLTQNADRIYHDAAPSDLDSDVDFLNKFCDETQIDIPEQEVDLVENRKQRRELSDRVDKSAESLKSASSKDFEYSDGLPDSDKFNLAYRHIELLGQVLRNFPGTLPGSEKLAILRATYLLGLRLMRTILRLFESSYSIYANVIRESLSEGEDPPPEAVLKIRDLVDRLMFMLNRLVVLGILAKISSSVGLADLESAYAAVLTQLQETNATRLLDLAVKLDHLGGFPETEVRRLRTEFRKNPFAEVLLKDLVAMHIQKFDVSRSLRQRLAALFKLNPNAPALIDPGRKR